MAGDTQRAEGSERGGYERPVEFGETALAEIGTRLWRGRWWIVGFGLLGLIAGVLLVARRGTVYEALARLYVEQPSKELAGADAFLMAASSKNFANTQAQIVRSGRVLREVLELPEVRQSKLFAEVDNPLAQLRKDLQVSVGRTDDIISVSLESEHVDEACFIVNQVVRRYQEQQGRATRETAQSKIGDLRERLQALDQDVHENIEEQKALLRGLGLGEGEGTNGASALLLRADPDTIRRTFQNRDRAALESDLAQERLTEAQALYAAGGVVRDSLALTASPQLAAVLDRRSKLFERSFELEEELERLSGQLGGEHPEVANKQRLRARMQAEIEVLGQQVDRAADAELQRLQKAAAEAKDDLAKFEKECERLEREEPELQVAQLELARLQREGELKFELAKQLRMQIADLALGEARGIDEDEDTLSVLVLDNADPKTARVTSSRVRLVALFLFLGLLVGGGLAWLLQSLDQTLRSVEDFEQITRLPVLGQLPLLPATVQRQSAHEIWQEHDQVAEAIRALRTAIRFGVRGGGESKLLQITSPEQSDGKSLTAALLAIALAEAGQRVLLVDADLRRPRVCRLFPKADNETLWEEIAATDYAHAQTPQILETSIARLSVLGSKHRPAQPATILTSAGFSGLFEWLRAHAGFDSIVVDSPPILPVADARIIAQHCDQTLLVARALSSTRGAVRHAESEMRKAELRLAGWVLNGVRSDARYGGYYHYRYRAQADEG